MTHLSPDTASARTARSSHHTSLHPTAVAYGSDGSKVGFYNPTHPARTSRTQPKLLPSTVAHDQHGSPVGFFNPAGIKEGTKLAVPTRKSHPAPFKPPVKEAWVEHTVVDVAAEDSPTVHQTAKSEASFLSKAGQLVKDHPLEVAAATLLVGSGAGLVSGTAATVVGGASQLFYYTTTGLALADAARDVYKGDVTKGAVKAGVTLGTPYLGRMVKSVAQLTLPTPVLETLSEATKAVPARLQRLLTFDYLNRFLRTQSVLTTTQKAAILVQTAASNKDLTRDDVKSLFDSVHSNKTKAAAAVLAAASMYTPELSEAFQVLVSSFSSSDQTTAVADDSLLGARSLRAHTGRRLLSVQDTSTYESLMTDVVSDVDPSSRKLDDVETFFEIGGVAKEAEGSLRSFKGSVDSRLAQPNPSTSGVVSDVRGAVNATKSSLKTSAASDLGTAQASTLGTLSNTHAKIGTSVDGAQPRRQVVDEYWEGVLAKLDALCEQEDCDEVPAIGAFRAKVDTERGDSSSRFTTLASETGPSGPTSVAITGAYTDAGSSVQSRHDSGFDGLSSDVTGGLVAAQGKVDTAKGDISTGSLGHNTDTLGTLSNDGTTVVTDGRAALNGVLTDASRYIAGAEDKEARDNATLLALESDKTEKAKELEGNPWIDWVQTDVAKQIFSGIKWATFGYVSVKTAHSVYPFIKNKLADTSCGRRMNIQRYRQSHPLTVRRAPGLPLTATQVRTAVARTRMIDDGNVKDGWVYVPGSHGRQYIKTGLLKETSTALLVTQRELFGKHALTPSEDDYVAIDMSRHPHVA